MKQLAVILFALLFFLNTQAQEKPILEFETPIKYVKKIDAHADMEGNILYLIFSNTECNMRYYDKEMNLKDTFTFSRNFAEKMPAFIGSSKNKNIIKFYLQEEKGSKKKNEVNVKAWEIDINNLSKTKLNQAALLLKNVNIIASYKKGDDFFFTYSPYESDTIKFLNLNISMQEEQTFTLSGSNISNNPKTKFKLTLLSLSKQLFRNKLWINVNSEEFVNISDQTSSKKYYHIDNTLYLISDENNFSKIIKLDLATLKVTIDTLESKKIKFAANGAQKISSFLLDDKLFQFHASSEEGRLNVYNTNNLQLLKTYSFPKKIEKIPFGNTLILYDDATNVTPQKPKKLLKKVMKTNAVIKVDFDVDSNYVIEMGSILTYTYNNYYYNHWMHQPPPINYSEIQKHMPTFSHGPNFNEDLNSKFFETPNPDETILLTFKTVLEKNSLKHLDGKPKTLKKTNFDLLLDKHDSFLQKIKAKFYRSKQYKYREYYHEAGYNKKTKTIQVYEIKPKEASK